MGLKRDLKTMTQEEAEEIFNCHTDGGKFEFPCWIGYHENGVGTITNKFSCHILQGNQKILNELFHVDYSKIFNPDIVHGYRYDGVFYLKKHAYKIKVILSKKYKVNRKALKGNLEEICKSFNENLEVIKVKKYPKL